MPDTLPLVTLYFGERRNSRCVTCDYWRHGVKDARLECEHAADFRTGFIAEAPAKLRADIQAGRRRECRKCVCSMWRDPSALAEERFQLRVAINA